MIWPVRQVATEKRRLEVLRYLASVGGYEANASLIKEHLRYVGVPTSGDELDACLMWLADFDLVIPRRFVYSANAGQSSELIVRVTETGRDVAQGYQAVPGIMQPDP
ncbi:MAG: hypothetical protein HC777_00875 [Hyphomonadaceae bacterium]|nr:hypothetical protein [Hyphomonadaceae bacterium]